MDGLSKNMELDMIEAEMKAKIREVEEQTGDTGLKKVLLAMDAPPIDQIEWVHQDKAKTNGLKIPLLVRYESIPLLMVVLPITEDGEKQVRVRFLSLDYGFQFFPPKFGASYSLPGPLYPLDECTNREWLLLLHAIAEEMPVVPASHMHTFFVEMCEHTGLPVPPYVDRSYATEVLP